MGPSGGGNEPVRAVLTSKNSGASRPVLVPLDRPANWWSGSLVAAR